VVSTNIELEITAFGAVWANILAKAELSFENGIQSTWWAGPGRIEV